jgi:hypothetical protein
VHFSLCFSKELLISFMKDKLKNNSDDVVMLRKDGTPVTLGQVFSELGITG